jgi:hypothetical protein
MDQAFAAGAQAGKSLGGLLMAALTGNSALKQKVYDATQEAMAKNYATVQSGRKDSAEADLTGRQNSALDSISSAAAALGYTPQQAALLSALTAGNKGANMDNDVQAFGRLNIPVAGNAAAPQGKDLFLNALGQKTTDVADGVAYNPFSDPGQKIAPTQVGMADIAAKMANAFQSKAAAANSYAQAEKARSEIGSGSPLGGGKAADWVIQQGADGQLFRVNKVTGAAMPVVTQQQPTDGAPVIGANKYKAVAQDQKAGKARAAVNSADFDLDRLAKAAQAVLDAGGLSGITGIEGKFPSIPGSKASDTQALLDTLKSQVGFSVLQNMRANSPTGGALGSVSDRENEMLQSNLAALGQAQSEQQYRQQLQNIIDYASQSKQRRHAAVEETFGTDYGGPQQSNSGGEPKPGDVDSGFRFKGGNPADPNSWEKL